MKEFAVPWWQNRVCQNPKSHQIGNVIMQHVAPEQIVAAVPILSRAERLMRWADLIRQHPYDVILVHGLEYWLPHHLIRIIHSPYGSTPFEIAANDPMFKEMGLADSSAMSTMNFFELSQSQLHEFSCDCGGQISADQMAGRVEGLRHRHPATPTSDSTPRSRFASLFRAVSIT